MNLKHPPTARRASLTTAACVLALAVTWPASSDPSRAVATNRVGCISTPDEYLTAWNNEFILPNMTFNDLPSYVNIELDLGKPSKRGFLYSGYCRISDR